MFSPLSSTLIYGMKDAVLVDPPLTIDQAKAVGDWVKAHGKKLTHIFATHGHGDHWFTAGMLAERLGAQVVVSAGTIEQMRLHVSSREIFWDKLWPGQIPPSPVTAVTVPNNHFTLEGHDLVIVEVGHSDTDESSVLHVPDLGLVVAGDAIYNGVHQYLGESANGGRDAWRKAIDTVKALRPRWVVAGHKNKDLDDDAARVIAETCRRTAQHATSSTLCSSVIRTAAWARPPCELAPALSTHCVIAMTARFLRRASRAGFKSYRLI